MTPRLVPYTWFRFVVPALVAASAALVGWWVAVVVLDVGRQAAWHRGAGWITADAEGWFMLAVAAGAMAAAQLAYEAWVDRPWWSLAALGVGVGGAISAGGALLGLSVLGWLAGGAADAPSLALRHHVLPWMWTGLCAALGPACVRLGRRVVDWAQVRWDLRVVPEPPTPPSGPWSEGALHGLAGLGGGALAALVWYQLGHAQGDLFLAAPLALWCLGFVVGGLCWVIPGRAYRGWVRVLVGARPGWRVPVDAGALARSERFVGHFPAGMDLHLPVQDGVDELHVSVLAHGDDAWAARGLSRDPVHVVRPLAWVDLSYDPSLAAPLETPLQSEDRVRLGHLAELELIVLPREEPG